MHVRVHITADSCDAGTALDLAPVRPAGFVEISCRTPSEFAAALTRAVEDVEGARARAGRRRVPVFELKS